MGDNARPRPTSENSGDENVLAISFTKDDINFEGDMRKHTENAEPGKMQVKIDGNRTKIKGDIEMKTVNSEARTFKDDRGHLQVDLTKDDIVVDGNVKSRSKNASGRQDINVRGNGITVAGNIENEVVFDS